MAKRAFFLLVLETKTFLSAFKSGMDELDMDVYWRSGHSDRFPLQIWCLKRPFSRGYGCACLVWSSLIFLALWRWFCWSFALNVECRGICGACRFVSRSWSACVYSSKTYAYLGALWEILRVNGATLLVKEWMIILTVFLHVLHCKTSPVICHLSHLHLSCTCAKKAFLGHWVVLCSPVEESSCGPF